MQQAVQCYFIHLIYLYVENRHGKLSLRLLCCTKLLTRWCDFVSVHYRLSFCPGGSNDQCLQYNCRVQLMLAVMSQNACCVHGWQRACPVIQVDYGARDELSLVGNIKLMWKHTWRSACKGNKRQKMLLQPFSQQLGLTQVPKQLSCPIYWFPMWEKHT